MRTLHPGRLFPPGVELALHGHVHLFESLNFASEHPATIVLGNSGSENEGLLPATAKFDMSKYVADSYLKRARATVKFDK